MAITSACWCVAGPIWPLCLVRNKDSGEAMHRTQLGFSRNNLWLQLYRTVGPMSFGYKQKVNICICGFLWRVEESSHKHVYENGTNHLFRNVRTVTIAIPAWIIAMIVTGLAFIGWIRGPHRRSIRRLHGKCIWCGYELKGLTGNVCPECGHPFTLPAQELVPSETRPQASEVERRVSEQRQQ